MHLAHLSIVNFRNIAQAELSLSPNVNCFVGANGMGKTNVLDAVYCLSFCKSALHSQDSQNVRHEADFFLIQGDYEGDDGCREAISLSVRRGARKLLKRNGKDCRRLAEHIGAIPLVMIQPSDLQLVAGGSEERRRFMDSAIAQYAPPYFEALLRYAKALQQRNALLRAEAEPDKDMMDVLEEMMAADADIIYAGRKSFVADFVPLFSELYARLSGTEERVNIAFSSHLQRGGLLEQLRLGRAKERIVGYTLHGAHKDDLLLELNGYPVRQEASQGQIKTYFIAMKLAQFLFLRQQGRKITPILLLDDVFDKLDAHRVERIVNYVSGEAFGQIFLTDTNRSHLDRLLSLTRRDYRIFRVDGGNVEPQRGDICPHDSLQNQ